MPPIATAAPPFGAVPDSFALPAPTGIELSVSYGAGGLSANLVTLSPGETLGRPDGRTVPFPERHLPLLEEMMADILDELRGG